MEVKWLIQFSQLLILQLHLMLIPYHQCSLALLVSKLCTPQWHTLSAVTIHWTKLLDWNAGLDYWTQFLSLLSTFNRFLQQLANWSDCYGWFNSIIVMHTNECDWAKTSVLFTQIKIHFIPPDFSYIIYLCMLTASIG